MWERSFIALTACALFLLSCGQTTTEDSQALATPSSPQPAVADLPSPAAALDKLPPHSASAMVLELRGSDRALDQHVLAQWNDIVLMPEWTGNTSPIADVAYAVYRFNLQGFTGPQTLQITFSAAPQDYSKLWFGFSEWGHDRWDWRASTASGALNLGAGGYAPYTKTTKGDMLVAVVMLGVTGVGLAKLQVGASAQGDWWMEGHDPQHTRRSAMVGPQANHLRWTCDLGDDVRTPPVIGADGTIYAGTFHANGNGPSSVVAISPEGIVLWTFATADRVEKSLALGVDGTVYAGSWDGNLYAINPDGTLKWAFTTGGAVRSALALAGDGTLYFGCTDTNVYAVNPDGTLKWSYPTGDEVNSSPALGTDGTIYVGSDDNDLYSIHPDGTLNWRFTTGNRINKTPAVGTDGTIFVASIDSTLYAVNPDGTLKWEYVVGDTVGSAGLLADGTIYVTSDDSGLQAINPDGSLKWIYTTDFAMRQAPAIGVDGTAYLMSLDVSAGSPSSRFLAIKADGTLLWSYIIHEDLNSAAIGPDGAVYAGSNDNRVYAFGP
jgi:outer membrane protein assembly factor BamB